MSTIQFRTDTQTKTASTALFKQLGITMTDAINLFLRQSILQGGIPFTLTIPKDVEASGDVPVGEAFIDALRRYKAVSNGADFDAAKAEPFLQAVEAIGTHITRITLQEQAVKVRLNYKGREYVIDYNLEEPNSVFILSRKDGELKVKDCELSGISKTLELF